MFHGNSSKDYDTEPVQYCARCYSLKIKYEETINSDYCTECGCLDTLTSDIHTWETLYERRYGKKYVTRGSDPKKTLVFMMPIDKLKTKVYQHPKWREIIKKIYPGFPGGLGKEDSVILFFDKIIKDNRLDDLRMLMLTMQN